MRKKSGRDRAGEGGFSRPRAMYVYIYCFFFREYLVQRVNVCTIEGKRPVQQILGPAMLCILFSSLPPCHAVSTSILDLISKRKLLLPLPSMLTYAQSMHLSVGSCPGSPARGTRCTSRPLARFRIIARWSGCSAS